jgi:hypothetical protein
MIDRTSRQCGVRACIGMRGERRTLTGIVAALMLAAITPAAAAVGAKCPASTNAGAVTPQYSNGLLRCQRVSIAHPTCPPTHLAYEVLPGADACRISNNGTPAGTRTAAPVCPANMHRVVDAGAASRDQCRGAAEFVAPLLGDH